MDKLLEYPWIIWSVVACVVLLIIVIIAIVLTKGKNKEVSKTDAEYDKIINDYIKEEKKREKNPTLNVEDSKPQNNSIEEIEETEEMEEDEDMLFKKKKKETATKTTTTPTATKTTTKTTTVKKTETKKPDTPEKRVLNGKYEVFSENDAYKYILKASNGEKLVESELYSSKDSVFGAIEAVKRNLETGKFSISKDKRDLHQFKLTASNNRTLVVSANYTSKQNAEKALESFKRFALNSPIVEVEAPKDAFGEEIIVEKNDIKLNGKLIISAEGSGFEFKLLANNGELLCTSQPYSTKANCEKGVDTLKDAVNDGSFFIYKDKNSHYQFKLYSKSQRLIAVGQTYADKTRAVSSANSVASFIEDAEIVKE